MSFRAEIESMEKNIEQLVAVTLDNIRKSSSNKDFVLDDENGAFKQHILNVAHNKFSLAYDGYAIEARIEKESKTHQIKIENDSESEGVIIIDNLNIKQEIIDEELLDEAGIIGENLAEQERTVSQSTAAKNVNQNKNEGREGEPKKKVTSAATTTATASSECNIDGFENVAKKIIQVGSNTESVAQESRVINHEVTTSTEIDGNFEEISEERSINDPSASKSKNDCLDGLWYYCYHCREGNHHLVVPYKNVNGVYEHWIEKHTKTRFQFYVGSQFVCPICPKVGNFQDVKAHFVARHPGKQFLLANPLNAGECGICQFKGDLVEHFKLKHNIVTESNIFNPKCFSENVQTALKSINIHKMRQCLHCNSIFHTEHQIRAHFNMNKSHAPRQLLIECNASGDQSPQYICGLCNETFNERNFFDHIKNHEIDCTHCHSRGSVEQIIAHIKQAHENQYAGKYFFDLKKSFFATKIMFKNGLVLTQNNLLKSHNYGNSVFYAAFSKLKSLAKHSRLSKHYDRSNDLGDVAKREHLVRQQNLLSTLCVTGLPYGNSSELMEYFLKLCNFVGEAVLESDIASIYKSTKSEEVVVKFINRVKKEQMVRAPLLFRTLNSDDFLKLRPGVRPKTICVKPALTNFYQRLFQNANKHQKNGKLISYRLSSQGLAIQQYSNGPEVYVKSCRELDNHILGQSSAQTSQKREFYGSGPSTSKQMRFD